MYEVNVDQAIKTLRREFKHLSAREVKRASARAINRTMATMKTDTKREVWSMYNLPAKEIGGALKIRNASASQVVPFARMTAKKARYKLMMFAPRATDRGVSVMVKKGRRELVKSAFIAKMPHKKDPTAGHVGIFARGRYNTKGFEFRHFRKAPNNKNDLQINELSTVGVPSMVGQSVVLRHMKQRVALKFPPRMRHELDWVSQSRKIS